MISLGPMHQGVGTAGLMKPPTLVSHWCERRSQFLEMHTRANSSGVQTLQARALWAEAHLLSAFHKDESPACVNCEEMASDLYGKSGALEVWSEAL